MASSILFINGKGEVLIYRRYRDDVSRAEVLQFCSKVIATKEAKEQPITLMDDVSYVHTTQGDITLVATTKSNPNAAMLMQFLFQIVNLCKAYFSGSFDENHIRDNFVLIYELLDEIMDYGYPQITDPDLLKEYITQGSKKIETTNAEKLKQITIRATGAISWRSENIRYANNVVYIDVIENVNVLISTRDTLLKSDVQGKIVMKTALSGMPECKLGVNDKLSISTQGKDATSNARGISIEDIKFHQCVSLRRFDKDRSITFIPPDGIFELMTYRVSDNVNLPFKLFPVVQEVGKSRVEMNLKVKALFDASNSAANVVIKLPVPKNSAKVHSFCNTGKAKYEPENTAVMWRIKKFTGESEHLIRVECELTETTIEKQWVRPPISMEFQVPMFTSSGLRVRFLQIIEKMGYKTTKWIRYVSKGGQYEQRI